MTASRSSTQAARRVSNWNIANVLTALRILLVPLFAGLLLVDGGRDDGYRWAAFAVFFAASITDRVDGDLARSRGLVTDLGKVLDPIADKALMGMGLIGLSMIGALWWWVTVVILVRELGITLLRFAVIRHGVIPASRGGKLKTFLQAIAIGLLVMPLPDWLHTVALVVMLAALAVTVVTGVDYVVRAIALRRNGINVSGASRADAAAPATDVPAEDPAPAPPDDSVDLDDLPEALVRLLTARGQTVATAESLTGGGVCAALTRVSGASAVVRGGVVAYATDVKQRHLGVDESLLRRGGAVQAEVAEQMAAGVRRLLDADWGLATTGVAGPTPQDGRPVGRVFVAVSRPGHTRSRRLDLPGDRAAVRGAAVEQVLRLAIEQLRGE